MDISHIKVEPYRGHLSRKSDISTMIVSHANKMTNMYCELNDWDRRIYEWSMRRACAVHAPVRRPTMCNSVQRGKYSGVHTCMKGQMIEELTIHSGSAVGPICWPFPAVLRPIIITAYLYTSMQKLQQQLHVHLSIIIIIILYFDEACSTAYGLEITVASVGKKLRYRIETVNLSCMQNIKFRKGHNDSQIR